MTCVLYLSELGPPQLKQVVINFGNFSRKLCFAFRYEIMMQCWSDDARNRPSFDELYGKLDFMLSTETAMVP